MPFEKIISPPVEEVEAGLGKQIQALDRVLEKPHAGATISETDLLKAIGRVLWRLSGLSAEEVLDALEEARAEERPLRLVISGETPGCR